MKLIDKLAWELFKIEQAKLGKQEGSNINIVRYSYNCAKLFLSFQSFESYKHFVQYENLQENETDLAKDLHEAKIMNEQTLKKFTTCNSSLISQERMNMQKMDNKITEKFLPDFEEIFGEKL